MNELILEFAKRKDYVLLSCETKKINGYDSWLCTWSDGGNVIHNFIDGMGYNEEFKLSMTLLSMTDEELALYCEENGIEWGNS